MNTKNKRQTDAQLSKQKLKQLESQTYSNRTLARLISTAELYALSLGYKNPQLYKKFDQFNNLKRKNPDELLGELIIQIQCAQVSITSYIDKYKKYDLPEDFDMDKTILELENIKTQVRRRDKKYYKAIIQLIQGDTNISSFDQELDELENDEEGEDIKDPNLQLKIDIPIMRYVDSVKYQVKNNYEKDPSYKVKLDLNKPFEKNEHFENLIKVQKDIDRNKKIKNSGKKNSNEKSQNNQNIQNIQYSQYNHNNQNNQYYQNNRNYQNYQNIQNNQYNQYNQYNQNNQKKNEEHKFQEFY